MKKDITVISHDPRWAEFFTEEAQTIKNLLQEHCLEIHHIGSTAVPGLCAKPKIDMLCIVDSLENSRALTKLSYTLGGEYNIPLRYGFPKRVGEYPINLHVVEKDHGFIELNLKFRDYLRSSKSAKKEYADLKKEILKDPESLIKDGKQFVKYNLRKDTFIKRILQKLDLSCLYVNFCMHDSEWKAYEKLCPQGFLHKDQEDHYPMVFYKGADIIGAAHVQFIKEKAYITEFHLDSEFSKEYFQAILKKWILSKGKIFQAIEFKRKQKGLSLGN